MSQSIPETVVYGKSPAADALPLAKSLNDLKRQFLGRWFASNYDPEVPLMELVFSTSLPPQALRQINAIDPTS